MRILLDAYFDNNFGDDLFADTLLSRYPEALFYAFWKKTPSSVLKRAAGFRNLVILPENCIMQGGWPFDAYVMIGGDVLPDGVDYTSRIACMEHVKKHGGFVAMLGFSLYENYGEKTVRDLKCMAALADVIVIRDYYSAKRFEGLVPDADVTAAADMAFAVPRIKHEKKKDILGIIPRRRLYSPEEEYMTYCRGQALLANTYLRQYPTARVRFLAYSTGEYDDRVTVRDIIAQMGENERRIEQVSYEGNIDAFCTAISECSALIPTRFHGLVFALINRQPFVPVPYEVKLTQLLDELGYMGMRIPYGKQLTQDEAMQAVEGLWQFGVSLERLQTYEKKAEYFFAELDRWYLKDAESKTYPEMSCAAVWEVEELQGEKQRLMRQVEEVQSEKQRLMEQTEELNKWIQALQQQKEDLEKSAEEQERVLREQNDELMKWIESLKKERALFERQNRELEAIRQWQWEKLMKIPLLSERITEEYKRFLKRLQHTANQGECNERE